MIITIDGPAGTGKTTIAKKVAEKLGFQYFDTGAMYRAVTYKILKDKVDLSDQPKVKNLLEQFHYDIKHEGPSKQYFVEGVDVTEVIRMPEITKNVSAVSAIPEVRESLVKIQRHFGKVENSVFEGRDMGTIVFPQAEVKIFLTARPAVRAERRYQEIKDKIPGSTQEDIMREILERDNFDTSREISPLKQAADAHLIDTSDLTEEEVVAQVVSLISKQKKNRPLK